MSLDEHMAFPEVSTGDENTFHLELQKREITVKIHFAVNWPCKNFTVIMYTDVKTSWTCHPSLTR